MASSGMTVEELVGFYTFAQGEPSRCDHCDNWVADKGLVTFQVYSIASIAESLRGL
jgi:hypothetical protein